MITSNRYLVPWDILSNAIKVVDSLGMPWILPFEACAMWKVRLVHQPCLLDTSFDETEITSSSTSVMNPESDSYGEETTVCHATAASIPSGHRVGVEW